jgi:hypothetical protein
MSDAADFEWTERLRYYFEENRIMVRQHDTNIDYGYEYLGADSDHYTAHRTVLSDADKCSSSAYRRIAWRKLVSEIVSKNSTQFTLEFFRLLLNEAAQFKMH